MITCVVSLFYSGLQLIQRVGSTAVLTFTFTLALAGCVTAPPDKPERPAAKTEDAPEAVQDSAPKPMADIKEEMIGAGLVEAIDAYRAGRSLRPYAAVYSSLGGIRPVQLNDKDRQASDSDVDLLLQSILALSDNPDLQAFALFGLAEDQEGRRWFVVHYESRQGKAQLRQYPLPPPAEAGSWTPIRVESSDRVIF